MRVLIFCSAFLLLPWIALGQSPDSTQALLNPIVFDGDSVQYFVGKKIAVIGKVINVSKVQGKDGTMGFVNMFKAYPNNPFSVTIFRQSLAFFEPIEQYEGKKVRVTGEVNVFKDKNTGKERYSIILRKPDQIEILGK